MGPYAGNGTYLGALGDSGPATSATLYEACGITIDRSDNLYVADRLNNRIRQITPDGIIRTVAGTGAVAFSGDGGPASAAALNQPVAVTIDQNGNLFFSNVGNERVRMIARNGTISTVAGNGSLGIPPKGAKPSNLPFRPLMAWA
jgi:sugar lactone lactonase YvrE